ncbi:DUF4430 domain-containing protein [Marinicrinis lubricantis]|uniref:DUF4430 domain-containing protein n=1 Tax=Marinicrinis lubricantis TaxID=2086470 RepID=A0ABW1ITK1_9BACL
MRTYGFVWVILLSLMLAACGPSTTSTDQSGIPSKMSEQGIRSEDNSAEQPEVPNRAEDEDKASELEHPPEQKPAVAGEMSNDEPSKLEESGSLLEPTQSESSLHAPEKEPASASQAMPEQSAPNETTGDTPAESERIDQVSLIILGLEAEELLRVEVEFEKGDTVLDILKKGTRSSEMPMEYRGSGAFSYVEGINNLYEFDYGPTSGWKYEINGEYISKSAGSAEVEVGDQLTWYYVTEEEDSE